MPLGCGCYLPLKAGIPNAQCWPWEKTRCGAGKSEPCPQDLIVHGPSFGSMDMGFTVTNIFLEQHGRLIPMKSVI